MRIQDALKEKMMDVRLVDKLIAEETITLEEYQNFLKNLPDQEGNYAIAGEEEKTVEASQE